MTEINICLTTLFGNGKIFFIKLTQVNDLIIPRYILSDNIANLELHGYGVGKVYVKVSGSPGKVCKLSI